MAAYRRLLVGAVLLGLLGVARPVLAARAQTPQAAGPQAMAGVAVEDATWDVGAQAGQYASQRDVTGELQGGAFDPNLYSIKDQPSYGVQSRLSIRALVVQGASGVRVAIVKADNYLAQDLIQRRVEQLLDPSLGITRHNMLWSASHDHSSPYDITPSAGVWLFQDAFDLRMFEYEARQGAKAITDAATHMVPVRMGATTVRHTALKGNIVGPQIADDGTPAGYPNHFGDLALTVMRFDAIADGHPVATWVNWGEHLESLDGYNLITADYLSALQRDVDRATGSTMVFSQGDVGSSEGPYDHTFKTPERLLDGVYREFAHMGYAQMERGAYELAQDVTKGWRLIGARDPSVIVPLSTGFPVGVAEDWVPGPISHPYPSVSNCRTQPTVDGNPGAPILGLPDCARASTGVDAPIWESLRAQGIPVPDHYDAPAFMGVEENLRIHLQAVRLGQVLLASCSCEAQVDLILNLKSRTDTVKGNIWDGYPWDQYCDPVGSVYKCEDPRTENPADRSLTVSKAAFTHMKAEIHNDAKGWDDPSNALQANVEPTDPALIKGNFTKQEIQDVCPTCSGFALPVGLGHTGDYNGYTVSYREYMNRDSYRKALTSYGPHTADYMVTRLVKMAAFLEGGPPVAPDVLDVAARGDEARSEAVALALGKVSSAEYDAYAATLPDDVGPAAVTAQPANITRFNSAIVSWTGGANAIDNPVVVVQKQDPSGRWVNFADQSGEVQTFLDLPAGVTSVVTQRTGQQQWHWRANFEAFDPFPAGAASQAANGTYRFVVDGHIHQAGNIVPYHLQSKPFSVGPWTGIRVTDLRVDHGGAVSFVVPPIAYPRTPAATAAPTFIRDDKRPDVCKTCSFRPWASTAPVASATVTVVRASGTSQRVRATLVSGRWVAATALKAGDRAFVGAGDVRDVWGEVNGAVSAGVAV